MRDAADAARSSRRRLVALSSREMEREAARAGHSAEVEREAATRLAQSHARRSQRQQPACVRAAWPPPLSPRPASCSPHADAFNGWGGSGDDAAPHRPPNLTERSQMPPIAGTEFVASSPVRPQDRQWPGHARPSLPSTPHSHHSEQRRRTPLTPQSSHRERREPTPLMPHPGYREQRGLTPLTPHSGRR